MLRHPAPIISTASGRQDTRLVCAHRCRPRAPVARCADAHSRTSDVEVEAAGRSTPADPSGDVARPMMSTVQTHNPGDDRLFKVLLVVITKLWSSPDQLERFILSRPEPTSMPFLMWLADQEAQASGQQQALLAALCEQLVVRRERMDRERMEQLYLDTLTMLTSPDDASPSSSRALLHPGDRSAAAASTELEPAPGVSEIDAAGGAGSSITDAIDAQAQGQGEAEVAAQAPSNEHAEEQGTASHEQERAEGQLQSSMLLQRQRQEKGVALLSSSPHLYAAMLAEKLTGVPATVDGYGPVYDLLLKAAPPAALTQAGIKKAHEDAEELASDMRQMRKRSVAALIGRAKLTAEQADRLKAGSPASRILDMLLSSAVTDEERVACLGDCFTPGEPQEQAGEGEQAEQATEELWCTPAQLLSEVDVRIRSVSGSLGPEVENAPRLLESKDQITGPELLDSLQLLRAAIMTHLLTAMQQQA